MEKRKRGRKEQWQKREPAVFRLVGTAGVSEEEKGGKNVFLVWLEEGRETLIKERFSRRMEKSVEKTG